MKTKIKRALRSTTLDQHADAAASPTLKKCKQERISPASCAITKHHGGGDHDGTTIPDNYHHMHDVRRGFDIGNQKTQPLDLTTDRTHFMKRVGFSADPVICSEIKSIVAEHENVPASNGKEIISKPQEIPHGTPNQNHLESHHQRNETSDSTRFIQSSTNMIPQSPTARFVQSTTHMVPQSPVARFTQSLTNMVPQSSVVRYAQSATNMMAQSPVARFTHTSTNMVPQSPVARFTPHPTNMLLQSPTARFTQSSTNMVQQSPIERFGQSSTNMVHESPTAIIAQSNTHFVQQSPSARYTSTTMFEQSPTSSVNSNSHIAGKNISPSVQSKQSHHSITVTSPSQVSNLKFTASNYESIRGHTGLNDPNSAHAKKQTTITQYNGFNPKTTTADVAEASMAALQLVQELASNSESARSELPSMSAVLPERQIQNLDLNNLTPIQEQHYPNMGNRLQSSISSHSFFQNERLDPVNQPFYPQKVNQDMRNMREPQTIQQRHFSQNIPVDHSGNLLQNGNYDRRHDGPVDRVAPMMNDLNYRYNSQQVPPDSDNLSTMQGSHVEPPYGVHRGNINGNDMSNYAYGDHSNMVPPMRNQRFPEHSGELGMPVMMNRQPPGLRGPMETAHPYNNQGPLPNPIQNSQWNEQPERFQSPRYEENVMHSGNNIRNRSEDPLSPPAIMKKHKTRKKMTKRSAGIEQDMPLQSTDSAQFSSMLPQQQNKPTELWVVNPSYAMNVSHKTLMSQYIEFLIEENEQITEMSQSFSMPVDIIVTEDLYIMDIARKDTPFPTPKFLDWVHKCYPRIDVQSFIYRQANFTREREMRRYYNYNMPPRQLLEDTFFYFQRKRMTKYCQMGQVPA